MLMQALYKCYKNVAFQLIETFQPTVANKVKQDFQLYLDAYDKMLYNQYLSLTPCRGDCGNIIEDYIAVHRTEMIKNTVYNYVQTVAGYVNM